PVNILDATRDDKRGCDALAYDARPGLRPKGEFSIFPRGSRPCLSRDTLLLRPQDCNMPRITESAWGPCLERRCIFQAQCDVAHTSLPLPPLKSGGLNPHGQGRPRATAALRGGCSG